MHPVAYSTIDVSVLVPVLNESRTIVEVVQAMTRQELDGTTEFLFADGGSADDTKAQLERLALDDPRIRVLENPRRGVASGLNVCLGAARGRYVARMDGHALYPPGYLHEGIDRLIRAQRTGEQDVTWVSGPQIPEPRGRVGAAIAAALSTWLGQGPSRRWAGAGGATAEWELDTGVFCGIWRRDNVLALGGWDEGWTCNEDSELAARFHDAGQRLICRSAMAARYIPRGSLTGLWRQYRAYGSYRVKTARRHPRSLRRSALLTPLLVLDAAASAAAPRPVRRLARTGQLVYGAALLGTTVEAGREHRGAGSAAHYVLVPVVVCTMHVANGVGFLEGCVRWGMPWRALWGTVWRGGRPRPYRGPVEAPSLHDGHG
jgi:glycosyltransferase involved in cell wall biosynthesis